MTHAVAHSGATLWTTVAVIVVASLVVTENRKKIDPPRVMRTGEALTLVVPRAAGPISLDPAVRDDDTSSVTTGFLRRSDGHLATPVAEARFVYTAQYLYVALIATDEDIRSNGPGRRGDQFRLVLDDGRHPVEVFVTPDGVLRGVAARTAREVSGTLDDARDRDHAWAVEVAVPLGDLHLAGKPGERIGFSVRRCDAPLGECATFGDLGDDVPAGRLVLGE